MKARAAKAKKSHRKLVLIVVASVVIVTLAAAIMVALFVMKNATSGETKFTGKITEERCSLHVIPSGNCTWVVDGTSVDWVSASAVWDGTHYVARPRGRTYGIIAADEDDPRSFDDNGPDIGKKVEVYGKRDGRNSVTLIGSYSYYIKAL